VLLEQLKRGESDPYGAALRVLDDERSVRALLEHARSRRTAKP